MIFAVATSVVLLLSIVMMVQTFIELSENLCNAAATRVQLAVGILRCLDPCFSWLLSQDTGEGLPPPTFIDEANKLGILPLRSFLAYSPEHVF